MVVVLKKQVASKLKVCTRTVELWVKDGRLPPPFYIGKAAAWNKQVIDAWLADKAAGTGVQP